MTTQPIYAEKYAQFDTQQIKGIFCRTFPQVHPGLEVRRDQMIACLSFNDTRWKKKQQYMMTHASASHDGIERGSL